eukprot:GEMP01010399.1.p1 GENE.GEMP01010399.1~~GEMP01010399.1.p1  ORF type:complete len:524 (+),score=115.26 GEMP01010399.1:565-2136(+)
MSEHLEEPLTVLHGFTKTAPAFPPFQKIKPESVDTPPRTKDSCVLKSLRIDTLPKQVLSAEYAVRGEIVNKSAELQKRLDAGEKLPFTKLVPCNIGNPQSVGQSPLTFHRQVLSLIANPPEIERSTYPEDVKQRAREYTKAYPQFGAYSHSKGIDHMRRQVAKYIEQRDGPKVTEKVDVEDIFITDGASMGVKTVLELLISSPNDGILIPIPQYPLYSASIVRLDGKWIGYEMDEDYNTRQGWKINMDVIRKSIAEFRSKPKNNVRAIAVINPGNPTGNVMSRKEIEDVIKLAEEEGLVILADEVYQSNVYAADKKFYSFRQVTLEMGSQVELFSFMSISKGYYGECGLRGGYLHATNIDTAVVAQLYKLFSMTLCSNTLGQAMMASIVTPPKEGDASYELFETEKNGILSALHRKAKIVEERLNNIEGVDCMPVEGAMYAFVRVQLPAKFIEEAKGVGRAPDVHYCFHMLELTGVMTVPGSGFGQKAGSYHYRMTILPEETMLNGVLNDIENFHLNLIKKYA